MSTKAEFPAKLEFLFQPSRYKFIRGGRGSGKSWGVARALLIQGAQSPQRILCTREVQKSIKQSVHQLLSDQIKALGLESFYRVLENEIRGKNGTAFHFNGLSDMTADSIKSFEGCTRVWMEEAHTITKRSLTILVPTIRAEGSEIWATYNPELETDEIHQMAVITPPPGTVSVEMNYSDNPWFPAVLEAERLHAKATMQEADYAHIWEGRCKPAVEGAIYFNEVAQAEQAGRLARVPYDAMLKAHAVWDFGFADSIAIIISQRSASEIRIIDYIEDNQRPLPDYVSQLHDRAYNWGRDYLPHDGFAKRHQTGRTDQEVLESLGRKVERTPNTEVEAGIRQARIVFPRIWFNLESEGVRRLVECLKRYRRNVSNKTGEPGNPLHDEYSHGADAFRYLCLVADQLPNTGSTAFSMAIPAWSG
nr:MAG: terminase large subunit [Caudoviricetes sp.]